MATKPLALSELGETFHVPRFAVRVAGQDLPRDVAEDVLSVTYRDGADDMGQVELLVNNWDADRGAPKYEPPSNSRFDGVFEPGRKVEVSMGYAGDLHLMVRGEITSLEPDFPASGGATLSVTGLDALHALRTERHNASWTNMTDTDIAKKICSSPLREHRTGLGIRPVTRPLDDEKPQAFVMQDSQFDVDFLLQRARQHGYELVLNEATDPGGRYLYFGVPDDPRRAASYRLEWGRTLLSFRPRLATSDMCGKVTVRAWDRAANAQMEPKTVRWDDVLASGPVHDWVKRFANAFEKRTDEVKRPAHDEREPETLSRDLMRKKVQGLITGSGSTVGLPGLRTGSRIVLQNLGNFSGTYYVTQTTHTIGSGGYRTDFGARMDLA
jgi:phage protein D